jgi:hypothetical protein
MAFIINLILVIAAFLSSTGVIHVSSPYIALSLFYYVFIYLPGYYLAKYFLSGSPVDRLEIVPVSLCAGYLFFSPLAVLAYILHMRIPVFLSIYIPLVAVWLVFSHFSLEKKNGYKFPKLETEKWVLWSLFGILGASFLMADYYGGFISGNFLQHVSVIRKLVSLQVIEINSPYLIDFKFPQNLYSTYYLFLALVSWISNLDPVHIWIYLPQFVFPVGLLANYYFARNLFKNNRYALLYVLVYFVYFAVYNVNGAADGHAWFNSELSACNNFLSLGIFLPVIMSLAFKYSENENKKLLIFLPLLFMSDGLIHLYIESKTYYMLYSVLFMCLLVKPEFLDWRKLLKITAFSSAGLILFFYFYMLLSPNINPDYHRFNGSGGSLNVIFKNGLPVYTDLAATITKDPLTLAGTACFLMTLFFVKSDLPAMYIFSVTLMVFFVLFNPLVLQLGFKIHPPMERITRLYTLIPFCMALIFPLYISGKHKRFSALKPVFILIIAAVLLMLLKDSPKRLGAITFTKQQSLQSLESNAMFYKVIRDAIPAGSVVMLNTPLTTWWTTYFPHYIVDHAFPFIFPPNIDETERVKDVNKYFADPLDKGAEGTLREYKVNYVFFLNSDIKGRNMASAKYLDLVLTNQMFTIYRVADGK